MATNSGPEKNKSYKDSFFSAFTLHTFVLDQVTVYDNEKGLVKRKVTNYRRLYENTTDYVLYILLSASLVLLIANIHTGFNKTGLSTLLAAFVAGLFAKMTIQNNKDINKSSLSTEVVADFFTKSEIKLEKLTTNHKTTRIPLISYLPDELNHVYEKRPLSSLQSVLNKTKSLTSPHAQSLFLTALAMKSKPELSEKVPETYSNYSFLQQIDERHITKLLNKCEALCQGIYHNIYSEKLVQNYIGSDLNGVTTVLLPYFYAKREIHIGRLSERKDILHKYSNATPAMYCQHSETHDLLYEYLEYYCYKWYWSANTPICFDLFHSQLLSLYQGVALSIKDKGYESTPYICEAIKEFNHN